MYGFRYAFGIILWELFVESNDAAEQCLSKAAQYGEQITALSRKKQVTHDELVQKVLQAWRTPPEGELVEEYVNRHFVNIRAASW